MEILEIDEIINIFYNVCTSTNSSPSFDKRWLYQKVMVEIVRRKTLYNKVGLVAMYEKH